MTNEKIYPDLSILILGHVDHGKTSLAKCLTGQWLSKYSEELRRGITIKLGYADFTIYRCSEHGYFVQKSCPICGKDLEAVKKISIVDAPGHEALITTMLSGAALVDAAILVIAANEPVPQPQTREHLMAFKLLGDKPLIVVQNKIDLVSKEEAIENYEQIKEFLKSFGYDPEKIPIIPVSSVHEINIQYVLEALVSIPNPERDLEADPLFLVSRSFDVNKPGTPIEKLVGGVLGGSLLRGKLKEGDEIEIRPGLRIGKNWTPIRTTIRELRQGGCKVKEIHPGGTAGISTGLDPFVTKEDTLSGQLVGLPGKLPEQLDEVEIKYELFDKVIGEKEEVSVPSIQKGDEILVSAYSIISIGYVIDNKKNKMRLKLSKPILANKGDKIILGKKIRNRWRIIGHGKVV